MEQKKAKAANRKRKKKYKPEEVAIMTIEEVVRCALDLGMSYGKFVALYSDKESKCRKRKAKNNGGNGGE